MTAEQIFKIIKELNNEERWKLLELMYDEYYNEKGKPQSEVRLFN